MHKSKCRRVAHKVQLDSFPFIVREHVRQRETVLQIDFSIDTTEGGKNLNEASKGDMHPSGQSSVLDENDLQAALDAEPPSSTRDLAEKLGVSRRTVVNKLHQFDFVHKKPCQNQESCRAIAESRGQW
ncbi:hypothetical protein KIN20_031125 [Parelaphostrongylus tenuis]|uniref:TyrR-like helix-turn-helix domain-containing protein n=1 Tax=Parelaphostrongylus tenuis TaxID=148309 RepID=A0AAD5R4Y8_PARTN|nr:hypothetical protein KIN20_031125 [Parelaphostrongylus tenuis]